MPISLRRNRRAPNGGTGAPRTAFWSFGLSGVPSRPDLIFAVRMGPKDLCSPLIAYGASCPIVRRDHFVCLAQAAKEERCPTLSPQASKVSSPRTIAS